MEKLATTPAWTSTLAAGFDGLTLHSSWRLPELNDTSCLVRIDAVSLNHRDIAIPLGTYPLPLEKDVVPCSDAAATVVATGRGVQLFAIGDRVCTLFNPSHQSGYFKPKTRQHSLGSSVDGTLRKYAVFDETALVAAPQHLGPLEAATLSCAAVTVWNAFHGIRDRSIKPGDFVLTQGTGGVSLFGAQIALATGATVIATTSSADKAALLKAMGVQYVINYREDRNWGETARSLTPEHAGVDHILDVGGDVTLPQSLRAIKMEGVITVVGFLGGECDVPGLTAKNFLTSLAIIRGSSVGSKEHFEALNKFLETHKIHPVVDSKVFSFEDTPEAFRYYEKQLHWGKIVIRVHSS